MRKPLYAFAAAASLFAATPCLALTVSTTFNRDTAQHLQQGHVQIGPALKDTLAGDERPQATSGRFTDEPSAWTTPQSVTHYDFGNAHATVILEGDPSPAWNSSRERSNWAPMSLSPPRR